MHLIINTTNLIVDICQQARYVRRQNNGVVILCSEESADAVYADDTNTFWPRTFEKYRVIQVDAIPEGVVAGYYFYGDGEYTTTEATLAALAKSREPSLLALHILGEESEEISAAVENVLSEARRNLIAVPEQDGAWDSSKNYITGDTVSAGGTIYIALRYSKNKDPETSAQHWAVKSLTPEYPAWDDIEDGTQILKNEVVSHGDSLWRAKRQHIKSTVFTPGESGTYWEVVSC